jgi:hypothetical protein
VGLLFVGASRNREDPSRRGLVACARDAQGGRRFSSPSSASS